MKKVAKVIILMAIALIAASCKSSCDCFKHSYGQMHQEQTHLATT